MTPKQIKNFVEGEDMDALIAKHIMLFPKSCLDHNRIPLPSYSTDRRYSSVVVDEIRGKHSGVIAAFNYYITERMKEIKNIVKKCDPIDFLIFIGPDDICRAALLAVIFNGEIF